MSDAVDVRRTMRCVAGMIRLRLVHRDAEPIVWRLLMWKARHQTYARVTISALARELRMGRAGIVAVLRRLDCLRVLHKQRTWTYRPRIGKKVQDVNRYVFGAVPPEFPGGTAIYREVKTEVVHRKLPPMSDDLRKALDRIAATMGFVMQPEPL